MQLFRSEALQGQDRLHGEVVLAPPLRWQALTLFLLLTVVAAALYLSFAQYGKVTSVAGRLVGSRGIDRALAPRRGRIESVLVQEGQRVQAGQPLVRISIAVSDGAGSLEERRAAAIARQDELLRRTAPDMTETLRSRMSALRAEIAGNRSEIASIVAQIAAQRELILAAAEDLGRTRRVAERGFVSQRDVREREEQLATRRQGLSRLEQELSARQTRISVADAELRRVEAEQGLQLAGLERSRAELSGLAAAEENARSIVVTAAQAGVVTGIAVHPGEAVPEAGHLLSIVPAGTRVEARIELPAAASGFIEPGQQVRLAIDAFPYQTYGTVEAQVDSISATTVPVTRPDGSVEELFLVRARLRTDRLRAFGRLQPLRPGMTLTARITTRSRSLAEWLFEPLFAVGRR